MLFTVTPTSGATNDAEYHDYLRLLSRVLLNQGINLTDVPRVKETGNGQHWLYVWPTAEDAREFADRLKEFTESPDWVVREVDASPTRGPLRPFEIEAALQPREWTFALAPWARKAIQTQFPGSGPSSRVVIDWDPRRDGGATQGSLKQLAEQVLPVLTGLKQEQLRAFGTYVVTDPVSQTVLLSPTPL